MGCLIRVDRIACDGHELCAERSPERIRLDEWGYPIVDPHPVPPELERRDSAERGNRARASHLRRQMFTKPTPNSTPQQREIAPVERERLPALPIFDGLPHEELDAIAEAAWTLELERGEPVATEGDFGHTLFFVEHGTADVVRDGNVYATVGPGDVVGEIAVLASGRRTASVVATSPMRLLALFKRDVWGLERRAPEAARRLQAVLDGRR